jgi:hypothetical protein
MFLYRSIEIHIFIYITIYYYISVPERPVESDSGEGLVVILTFYFIATAFGGDAIPPSRFIGTETSMHS